MNFPDELKYTKDHEWARIEGNVVTIGITDHAQSALGDVVFVELPEVGQELDQKESFGVVESIKAVSDLYAPVQGKVVEINEDLSNEPALINENPYENGWIAKIEITDQDSLKDLLDSGSYAEYVDSLA